MVAPFLSMGFILAAVSAAPWWSITEMSISRLAGAEGDTPIWSATGAPAVLLNSGLLIGGALMMVFSFGLLRGSIFERSPGLAGRYIFLVGTVLMMLIGVFPLTLGLAHDVVSYSFFILTALSLVLMGVSAIGTQGHRNIGRILVLLGIFCILPFLLPLGLKGLAIPEFLALLPLTMFSTVTGFRMLTLD